MNAQNTKADVMCSFGTKGGNNRYGQKFVNDLDPGTHPRLSGKPMVERRGGPVNILRYSLSVAQSACKRLWTVTITTTAVILL
ncbi:MAG: hypothetical protein JNL47_11035 [Bacteroidia bacterium]|nr:hypothetical protein [Bacteroidia bacterium]